MQKKNLDARKLLGQFIDLLVDYFRVFGEKPCCSKDIVLFLNELDAEQRPDLASKLIQLCNISSTTLPQTVSLHCVCVHENDTRPKTQTKQNRLN